ncbi:MAG: DNA polymerase Y family protein [Acidimicrobiia bacterium]|nr:DNA polymerase Y family protein [Acidimicrobiia bacterium]
MSVTRTLAVWCPDWPVVAGCRSFDELVAVVHANRVVACTPAARSHGVTSGLRRRVAQGRCPGLVVLERDPAAEARHFEAIAAALDAITPRLELSRPGSCLMTTRGPSRYFGGDAILAERVVDVVTRALEGRGSVRVGIADGPFAAELAARRARDGGVHIVAPGESPAFLAPLSVRVLDRPDLADVLVRLGLGTLGVFAALDRAAVVGRFGTEGSAAHRLAAGLDERPPAGTDPPPDLEVVTELDPPVERVDRAAFVAKVMADELDERLAAKGAISTRVLIGAETEHGEIRERLWRHEGALGPHAVAERVRWQLDGWLNGSPASRPTGGLVKLVLRPDEIGPARGRQLGFWGGRTEVAERAARGVARVQGLLGPRSVSVPERRGGRQPHEQLVLVPVDGIDLVEGRVAIDRQRAEAPWPGRLPPPSPMVVRSEPLPALVVDEQREPVTVTGRGAVSAPPRWLSEGDGSQLWLEIVGWAGPWPLDERWWDPDHRRRRARFQVVTNDGKARLLGLEAGRWWVDAAYE